MDREKQVIEGHQILDKSFKPINILIFADSWPSLAIECLSLGKINSTTIVSDSIPESIKVLFPSGIIWKKMAEIKNASDFKDIDRVVFQGKMVFVETILNEMKTIMDTSKLIILCKAQCIRKSSIVKRLFTKWIKVSHAEIGGVTDTKWLIGSSDPQPHPKLPDLIPTHGLTRRFSDILKPDQRGIPMDPPKEMPELIEMEGLMMYKMFAVPSVFARTGWVLRKLSFKEIGSVYDLPELYTYKVYQNFESNQEFLMNVFDHEFAPLKVVNVVRSLMFKLGSDRLDCNDLQTNTPSSSLSHSIDSNLQPIVKTETPAEKPELICQPLDNIPTETSEKTSSRQGFIEEYLAAYGEKAAKDDDARIPVELWNGWLFHKHLTHIKYVPEKHDWALEVLREKFALRIYIINITKS